MELHKDILKYNYNRKTLDGESIVLIIKSLVDFYSLREYVECVEIKAKRTPYLGAYLLDEKKIIINPYVVRTDYRQEIHNLYIINTILHEIEHAIQSKMADDPRNDSLRIIVKEGIELGKRCPTNLNIYELLLYKMFYQYILIERNAEITANIKLLRLNEELDILSTKEIDYLKFNIINRVIMGYTPKTNPVKKYYRLRHKQAEYNQIPFNESYSIRERLSWGMPIDDSLFQEVKKEYRKQLLKKEYS